MKKQYRSIFTLVSHKTVKAKEMMRAQPHTLASSCVFLRINPSKKNWIVTENRMMETITLVGPHQRKNIRVKANGNWAICTSTKRVYPIRPIIPYKSSIERVKKNIIIIMTMRDAIK